MIVKLWGTRGSLASPGPDTVRYGGNTSCVSVEGSNGTVLVLDAGTGVRVLGQSISPDIERIHILFTHLHMDHVQGLPFFEPLRLAGVEVHIWGPANASTSLENRLVRYLSPPLFPVRVHDLLSKLYFHELSNDRTEIGEFEVKAQMVIHPNPTLGFRIQENGATIAYLPDHEPALGAKGFPESAEWTSGYDLSEGVDLLIHDCQYTTQEYTERIGFGHSSIMDSFRFAAEVNAKELVPFHHDPGHSDDLIDDMILQTLTEFQPKFTVTPGMEGAVFTI